MIINTTIVALSTKAIATAIVRNKRKMVYRGRRTFNRSDHEEEKKEDDEEFNLQNAVSPEEAARLQRAHHLAEEALRMAIEAREAARRLREYRTKINLPYRRSNMIHVDETSTLREGDDAVRTL